MTANNPHLHGDGIWFVLYGVLTVATVAFAWRGRDPDVRLASAVLATLYVFWNLCHWFMKHPYSQLFPLLDGVTIFALVGTWYRRLQPWKVALILMFVTDMAVHVVYAGAIHDHATKYAYDLAQNLVYVLQLTTVTWGALTSRVR